MPKLYLKYYSCILCLVLLGFNAFAQSPLQVISVGDELFEKGEYYGSIGFYEKAMSIDSSNAEVLYKYGINLLQINNPVKASRYLLKSSLLGGAEVFPELNFELAQAYHQSGDYRKAKRFYNRALRPYRSDRKSQAYQRIDQAKDAADWAYKQKNKSSDIELQNLGLETNSVASDFAGSVYNQELFFTALIADSALQGNLIQDEDYYAKIYWKKLNSSDKPKAINAPPSFSKKLKNKHMANFTLSKGGDAYFSVCDTNFQCEIWQAKYQNGELTEMKALNQNINFPGVNNTMPELVETPKGSYLYFASNRVRGFGGLDIWVAKQEDFGFDEAINLGAKINTPGDELSPRYHLPSKTLFFSSNWHNNFGGFDIFKSEGEVGKIMAKAENLGQPINSTQNDLYFFPFQDSALLSSNRTEGNVVKESACCNDLYILPYPLEGNEEEEIADTLEAQEIVEVSVNLLNQYLPLELYFHNDMPNPNSRDTTTKDNYLSLAYDYLNLEGEYIKQFEGYAQDEEQIDQLGNFFDDELSNGIEDLEKFTPLLLAELRKGSHITLNIKGYASSLFNESYNLNLTLRRIESFVNYLRAYRNGVFLPYLENNSSNEGKLKIQKFPYGEYASQSTIDEDDKTLAVYSYEAAKQRKIQLIGITKDKNSKETDATARIKLNTTTYSIDASSTNVQLTRFFIITNVGNESLEIYNLVSNLKGVMIDYPKVLKSSEKGKIRVSIPNEILAEGENLIDLMLVSNADKNLINLKLKVTK